MQLAMLALFLATIVLTARGAFAAVHPWIAQLFLITDPLILLGTALAGAASGTLLAALVIVGLSLLAPRAYCGWICPLGTTMDIVDRLLFRRRDRPAGAAPKLRQMKYALLLALAVLAAFNLGVFGWFDPICIATRSYATAVYPVVDHAAKLGLISAERAGSQTAANAYDWASRNHLVVLDSELKSGAGLAYHWAAVFMALFLAILVVQAYQKRFWCRNLCPLGALLGLLGSLSPLRPRVSEKCIACDACRKGCKTGAFQRDEPDGKYRGLVQECILCYACERDFCPVSAIHVGGGSPVPMRPEPRVMPGRRAFLGAAATGAILGPAMLLDQRTRGKEETAPQLRPPGALRPDAEFLSACVRCGECIRVCPTNALQPSGIENGIAGLWTPTFVYNIGACDFQCAARVREGDPSGAAPVRSLGPYRGGPVNLCAMVCPTEAIARLTHDEKVKWKIGTAEFDKNRCLPWARSEECLTCEEQCPLPEKAISHATADVPNREWLKLSQPARHRYEELEARQGRLTRDEREELAALPPKMRPLALPFTLRDRCIGCGTCENVCPVDGPGGIRVRKLQTQEIKDARR